MKYKVTILLLYVLVYLLFFITITLAENTETTYTEKSCFSYQQMDCLVTKIMPLIILFGLIIIVGLFKYQKKINNVSLVKQTLGALLILAILYLVCAFFVKFVFLDLCVK